ncbi:hypothetical protein [Salinisphaera orenii]|uniref:hypothetical protein n=1 Tax=Salinisphaera orenii TaxID=856731 RepID=UPI0011CDF4C4|nr:hypothetical protein [Salinisphaera halophila]
MRGAMFRWWLIGGLVAAGSALAPASAAPSYSAAGTGGSNASSASSDGYAASSDGYSSGSDGASPDAGTPEITGYGTSGEYGTNAGDDGDTGDQDDSDQGDSDQDTDGSDGENSDPDDDNEQTPPTSDTDPGDVGDTVVSVRAIRSGQSNGGAAPLTFGQVFARGAVPENDSIHARVDDRLLPTQVDAKARWDDGSLRHAVISTRVAPSGNDTRIDLARVEGDEDGAGSPLRIDALLASDFNARIEIKARGTRYTVDARDLLNDITASSGGCSDWGRQCKQWLSGPQVSEWIVGGPLEGAGGESSRLAAYFHIRAYADDNGEIERARVDTVVENNWAYPDETRNAQYNVTLEVGDEEYRNNGLKHYRQARWHRVLWWNDDPGLYARIDTDYLQSTGAISQYADVEPTSGLLNSVRQSVAPMNNGDQTDYMPTTGAQAAIGPLPRWTSAYAVSGDRRAFRWMLANDDAIGSYGVHYRDRETGRPLEITRHPYVTIANRSYAQRAGSDYQRDLLPGCQGDCNNPYEFDISHHPSTGYVPYLVTGDFYYLEEMQFIASYVQLWANPEYRDYKKGTLRGAQSQVRGQAWSLRSFSDAAFATPDDDPMKSYFTQIVDHVLDDYNDTFVDSDRSPLHVINNYGAVIYPSDGRERVGIAPWQADFFTWAAGHAAEQRMPGADKLVGWLADFQIERMTGWQDDPTEGYCWLEASTYSLQIRPNRGADDYDSLEEAYAANFPELVGTRCNSARMRLRMGNMEGTSYQTGEMVGYANSTTGFPANMQPGLAMAVDSDHPDAAAAWRIFEDREVKPNYDNQPNFAVVPRSR